MVCSLRHGQQPWKPVCFTTEGRAQEPRAAAPRAMEPKQESGYYGYYAVGKAHLNMGARHCGREAFSMTSPNNTVCLKTWVRDIYLNRLCKAITE